MATPNMNPMFSLDGPVAILWDMENCPVPSDVRPEDVAGNVRMALRVHPIINGAVTLFSAYGDFNAFPRRLREGCQRTGVKLVDVPNGRKDAADKAILIDMFLFALDNRPPSSIMLISGDVDFAPALHILGQRGYTVILVIPSRVGVSSALSNAGRFVWDWHSVARGEGFVPTPNVFLPPPRPESTVFLMGGAQINDSSEIQNEEESIVYKGVSRSSLNEFSSSSILMLQNKNPSSSCLNEASGCGDRDNNSNNNNNNPMWVQPGDLNGLKGQIVKLLEVTGGSLLLTRLPAEYQKTYGRPLYVSEYGALKLVNLINKMSDAISIEGKGQKRLVRLRGPTLILARRDNNKKGKAVQEEDKVGLTAGSGSGSGSSDGVSDDEKPVVEENEDSREVIDEGLEKFKYELQDILVSYCCRVSIDYFEAIYELRHKKRLDYPTFGVTRLEELLEKVRDVVVLQDKFLVAVGG